MLQLKHISKQLGEFSLEDIDVEIQEGEYFIILGSTGTGKTVILEIIAGMYQPDQGEIWFYENNLGQLYPEQREIGFVYQDYALFPHLTVQENILFGMKIRKYPEKEMHKRLTEMVEMLRIEHLLQRYPATLSGGEQQRTAIARALVTSPKIFLLDEPLSALDPTTKASFQKELKKIHERLKTTTLHVTHDFNEALYLADRIGVMHQGKLVQVGTPLEVFRQPQSTFVAQFVGMENIFEGHVVNSHKVRLTSGIDLDLVTEERGKVNVAIRPEDIIVSKEPFVSSARNKFQGRVMEIANQGLLYKITIDAGVTLNSLVTSQSLAEMNIELGDTVWATFKSAAIHVF